MGYVPYVSFATYHCATVNICLYFKRLMFMQIFCKKKKKIRVVIPCIIRFDF